jgi:hypothetical protein
MNDMSTLNMGMKTTGKDAHERYKIRKLFQEAAKGRIVGCFGGEVVVPGIGPKYYQGDQ